MFVLKAERRVPKKVNGEWILTYRIETVATSPILTREFRELALEQETDSRRVWVEEA